MVELGPLDVSNGIEDAGKPMSKEGEAGHEKQQYCSTIFGVLVHSTGYSQQSQ